MLIARFGTGHLSLVGLKAGFFLSSWPVPRRHCSGGPPGRLQGAKVLHDLGSQRALAPTALWAPV